MLFFVIMIIALVALVWFLVHFLVPSPVRWILGIALDLLFLILVGWGIVKMRKRFGVFDFMKVILRSLFELAKVVLVLILPSLILLFVFCVLR